MRRLPSPYDRDEEDLIFTGIPQLYCQLLSISHHKEDGIFLLTYHLLRSLKLRKQVASHQQLIQIINQLGEEAKHSELCKGALFLIHSEGGMGQLHDAAKGSKEVP